MDQVWMERVSQGHASEHQVYKGDKWGYNYYH